MQQKIIIAHRESKLYALSKVCKSGKFRIDY